MIQVWTGDNAEHLAEQRRGNDIEYASKRVALDYDATIRHCADVVAVLRTANDKPIVLMLVPDVTA